MWQDLSCQPPLMISTAKSFGYMAKYFCTKLPTSLNAFCPKNIITHALVLKEFGFFLPQRYGMAKCLHIPTSWSDVWKSVEAICLFFAPVFSQISCCSTMTNSGYKRDCIRNRSRREEKDTPCDIVILGYCDIGIISQVWAALHNVGNRIMWWEGQSAFLMGRSVDRVYFYGFGCTGLSWFLIQEEGL